MQIRHGNCLTITSLLEIIMKSLKLFTMGLLLVAGQALAGTIPHSWTSTYDPNPDVYVGPAVNFSFDITTGPFGYRPGIDSLDQSTLDIRFNLYDDGSDPIRVCIFGRCRDYPVLGLETAYIDLPGWLGDNIYTNLGGTETGGSISSLWSGWDQLADTGKLDVSIYSTVGDFMFGSAELKVSGNRIPEPGSLALLAAGIGMLAVRRRKKLAAN
jgi:hypothetical protein